MKFNIPEATKFGKVCGYTIISSITACIVAVTVKFIIWLF